MEKIEVTATNMSKLTQDAFMDCLFKEGEDTINHVKVEGITYVFGLHPQRLESKRELVKSLLANLSTKFKEGHSFLDFCNTKNGTQWTDMQRVGEQLMVMAMGLGLMEYCMPREMWKFLPGGVPYLIFK